MKKLLMVLALVSVSFSAMAQDDPTLKYSVATNSFWSNWFIQVGAQWNAWYSADEHGAGLDRSPLEDFRSNPGAAIAGAMCLRACRPSMSASPCPTPT